MLALWPRLAGAPVASSQESIETRIQNQNPKPESKTRIRNQNPLKPESIETRIQNQNPLKPESKTRIQNQNPLKPESKTRKEKGGTEGLAQIAWFG